MACILAGAVGSAAQATNVEFRILERRGQTAWNPFSTQTVPGNDNVLNFTVQARVVGGTPGEALGNFGFDIVSNEAQGNGTLAKARITTAGTPNYDTSAAQYGSNATVGTGGLAGSYAYLASVNPNFNGLINASGGSFTENPAVNDLGLVTGSPTAGFLLLSTDSDGDGNPDTYSGSGSTAPLDPALADQFFAADGNWLSMYNFNYTVSNTSSRVINFSLANVQAQTFHDLALANSVWGPNNPVNAMQISAAGINIPVSPAPGAAALLGLGGLVAARRRRTA